MILMDFAELETRSAADTLGWSVDGYNETVMFDIKTSPLTKKLSRVKKQETFKGMYSYRGPMMNPFMKRKNGMGNMHETIEVRVPILTSTPTVMVIENLKGKRITLSTDYAEVLYTSDPIFGSSKFEGIVELPKWLAEKIGIIE